MVEAKKNDAGGEDPGLAATAGQVVALNANVAEVPRPVAIPRTPPVALPDRIPLIALHVSKTLLRGHGAVL